MKSTHETDADRQNGRSNVNNNNNKDVVASNYFKSMMSKGINYSVFFAKHVVIMFEK